MKKYLPYVKRYWYCFLLGPLFMIIEACGEFILPYISGQLINLIDNNKANPDFLPNIIAMGVIMAVVALVMMLAGVLGANFAIRGAAHLAAGVRRDVFNKVQTYSFTEIDGFTTGSLITRLTNDVTQIQNFCGTLLRGVFRSPVMLIGALVMSFVINPDLAWVIIGIIPFLALAIFFIIKAASPRYSTMQTALDDLNGGIRETVTNERVIKSFVREEHEIEKFEAKNSALVAKSTSALKVMLLMMPASAIAVNLATILVVALSAEPIMIGSMAIGDLTSFITYLGQVLTALNFLANIILQGARAGASDRRIGEVLNAKEEHGVESSQTRVVHGSVEFRGVSFRYFKNNHDKVLDDISFRIEAGQTVGIIGSTGSGKTTLVSMIPRLYDPDDGEILIDGVTAESYPLHELRDSIAMVLQKNTLFAGTVAENLRWGNENATLEQMRAACRIASADGFISAFPEGYDTEIGREGSRLSGGQRQRLCIARALLKDPKIIILDDSTSAVDTATDASIRRAFGEQMCGVTKIIIAQRIASVRDADKIIVMDGGRIVGIGTHDELIDNCREYDEIYYSQCEREVER